MNTQTQVATIASVQEKVRERIQQSFLDLIPPELWDQMVSAELNTFTGTTLPELVREEAKAHLIRMIRAELQKPEWTERWGNGKQNASELMTLIVKECAPELVSALFSSFAQQIAAGLRNGNVHVY